MTDIGDTDSGPQGVVVVLPRDGLYLFIKRGTGVPLPGRWGPVSGRIERGERQQQTVEREVLEEVGIEVRAVRKLMEGRSEDGRFQLHYWLAEHVSGEPYRASPDEVAEVAWLRLDELRALPGHFPQDVVLLEGLEAE